MLYWLLYQQLYPAVRAFNAIHYVTTRAMLASLTSLFLCIALGPWLIQKLRYFQIGQHIREDGPKSHMKKAGTPTMGGVLIVISIVVPTLLWADLRHIYVWIALFGLVSFAIIGFIDDYAKVMNKRNLGLTSCRSSDCRCCGRRHHGCAWGNAVLQRLHDHPERSVHQTVSAGPVDPFADGQSIYVPLAFLPFYIFFVLVVVGSSNAVNVTDGLDGLAIGLMVISAGALTVLAYTGGNRELANYLQIARNPRTQELTIFCGSMTGASLGFLWWNSHPADIFMGDVGRFRWAERWSGGDSDQAGDSADLRRGHVCD